MPKSPRPPQDPPPVKPPAAESPRAAPKKVSPKSKALSKDAPAAAAAPALPAARTTPTAVPAPRPRVLIAHSDAGLLRLTRESLETFLECEVRTTTSALTAFDRILQEPYRLLLLDLHLPDLPGELLYDLVARAYPRVHTGVLTAPPVVWLGLPSDLPRQDSLTREARTKALLLTPINIQRLLDTAAGLLPRRA